MHQLQILSKLSYICGRQMWVTISKYQVKQLHAEGGHVYLKATAKIEDKLRSIEIFFRDRLEEKKIFQNATIVLNGEIVEADGGLSLINSEVIEVKLNLEIPIDNMTIKDRLNASGLIHEFKLVFRKDKIRAREILKVLGVSESYAEEILLRNSYVLPLF